MKKCRFLKLIFCAIMVLACVLSGAQAFGEASAHRVEPLAPTLDTANLSDCMFSASFASGDIYLDGDGALVIHMTVYDNELFDLVDIANLAVGDIIVIDGEEQAVASIATDAYGCILINGGYEEDGCTLTTDESGVYHVIDFDDMPHYRALGEATLRVAQEFTLTDSSDLDASEKVLYAGDLLTDIAPADLSYTAYNTTVTVENGFITNIRVVYVP